jgi:exonuclease VII small subunit
MDQNTIKITDEELQKIKKIADDYRNTVLQFGELHLERIELQKVVESMDSRQAQLENSIVELKKLEQITINSILEKYGEGSLNIKDGTFTKNP